LPKSRSREAHLALGRRLSKPRPEKPSKNPEQSPWMLEECWAKGEDQRVLSRTPREMRDSSLFQCLRPKESFCCNTTSRKYFFNCLAYYFGRCNSYLLPISLASSFKLQASSFKFQASFDVMLTQRQGRPHPISCRRLWNPSCGALQKIRMDTYSTTI
jgi:hypothetical protein